MELSVEQREAMGFFLEEKSHGMFDVSVAEYARAMHLQRARELAQMSRAQLIEMGVLLSSTEAARVEQELLMEDLAEAEDEHREQLQQILASYSMVEIGSQSESESDQEWPSMSDIWNAGTAIKEKAQEVGGAVRDGINSGLNKACDVSRQACLTGCQGLRDGAQGLVSAGSAAVQGGLAAGRDLAMTVLGGVSNVIEDILSKFELAISISGSLDPNEFSFSTDFTFRFGDVERKFSIAVCSLSLSLSFFLSFSLFVNQRVFFELVFSSFFI
jgi:hypothetical protein